MAHVPPASPLYLLWVVAQTTHADIIIAIFTLPSVPFCRFGLASTVATAWFPGPHGPDANGEIKIFEPYGYDANGETNTKTHKLLHTRKTSSLTNG